MIQGAIFDVDGTLLDSMPIWDNAGELYLKNLGITAEQGLGKLMFTMSMHQGADYLKQRYQLGFSCSEIITGINQTIEKYYEHEITLKLGVRQFLGDMKQKSIPMVIATSSDRGIIEKAFQRLDILHYFDRIFTCSEVGAGKSKPDIYLAARDYMGTPTEATWVFEDALYAIRTAKDAGFPTAGIYDEASKADQDEIKSFSDIYLTSLRDFHTFWLKKVQF